MTGTRSVSTSRCTAARSPRAHAMMSWKACLSGSGLPWFRVDLSMATERSIRKLLLKLLLRPATCNAQRINGSMDGFVVLNIEVWVTPQMWPRRHARVIILPTEVLV